VLFASRAHRRRADCRAKITMENRRVRPRTRVVPSALAVAAIGAALLTRLVYLDVWNREVPATEDPGLREPALGPGSHGARLRSLLLVVLLGALAVVTMKSWLRCANAFARPSRRIR
jgi:hypothetical protein